MKLVLGDVASKPSPLLGLGIVAAAGVMFIVVANSAGKAGARPRRRRSR